MIKDSGDQIDLKYNHFYYYRASPTLPQLL